MRIFDEMNTDGKYDCPICGTKEQKPVVLIPMAGKGDRSDKKVQNCEARQFHVDCLDLWFDERMNLIYQRMGEIK